MDYKVANDLLALVNSLIDGKFFFISKIRNNMFTLVKVLDNGMNLQLNDGDTLSTSDSYCQQIVNMKESWVIDEAQTHPFTSKLALTKEYNIQSYVGVPVFYKDGGLYGTICALDTEKSKFTDKEVDILTRFSNLYTSVVELEKRVKYDKLTTLHNRDFLYDNFEKLFHKGSLLLLDLDGFKEVNDQYGHEVGDLVLREVGERIRNFVGLDGAGFRLGGDEFVTIFPDVTEKNVIEDKATSLLKILADWEDFHYEIGISASIGISLFPIDGSSISQLLKKADIAMYQAKQMGKNAFRMYRASA
ncbi:sensor domain-containing diguanylate cyclase [Robertmurraya korlensis]|uniref:sensor domain-containing diguanylate cyclase n=1 Tax=Robertmurraya korlensis TaxID=519977 RepID=UPI000825911B|nr:sensor domain-containing diguanylate cyclase [Robertmurraya korlensis]